MISTYIISLASETRRRAHMKAQAERYQLNAAFFDAVDMRQATQTDIEHLSVLPKHKKPKKQRWLSKGELGCALSHHQIYQEMINKQLDYAFILEDDARFLQSPKDLLLPENLRKIAAQYDFDILILGYVKTLEHQLPYYHRRIPIKKRATLQLPEQTIQFGTPWEQYGCGAVAYVITKKGAEKLLNITQKPCVPADDWLYFEQHCGVKVLHARPTFVLEDLEQLVSTIRVEKANFLQPKLSSIIIRSIKGWCKHIAMNYLGFK
ncbi:glycosyltransferase family 25 protein [Kingella kingae]|uniref:glycosyltransferase family 25 protein n=1 Tax=Kingella kingae TaxID=504 RepID=UPI00056E03BD|nr:glycosyltransferase family 25 protein [Kingella kingae]MDK4535986.1 glycosyltransferase family 25 protein [Kingella kingae]MDK4538224.1 glycosyltransferase family 25 protein [Kingella kingae]MDK4545986.1 glycosyltransferase family 25 protein [Kingella kingae]MDK4580492.1 glycosyltransferase family 25 protein [Kingella kingae]MDK4621941.1 glycosyltransferase family 25 protein [Kingella kingae]